MLKKVKGWLDTVGKRGENIFGALEDNFEAFVRNQTNEGKQNLLQDPNFNRLDDKHNYLVNAYNLTATAKIKGIQEFVETLLENRVKFLIFGHHYAVLDAIEETVTKKKVSHVRIDGKIESSKRYEAVRKFQTDSDCLVAVLALTACCTGITLTAASTVVFAEMTWTPGVMVQAEDRAHRIGQINAVNIYYLFGESTLDQMIYPRLKLKSEVFSSVLDGASFGDFRIDNDDEGTAALMNQELRQQRENGFISKKYEQISKKIQTNYQQDQFNAQKGLNVAVRQGNISEYFFCKNVQRSKIGNAEDNQICQLNLQEEISQQQSQMSSILVDDNGHIIDQQDSDDQSVDYDSSSSIQAPFPLPPLQNSIQVENQILQISSEDWDEGCNAKFKAYQKLREEKDKLFEQNKVFKKYRSIWRGLKRCHKRATQPNKLTEYEIPTDIKKYNRVIDDFDPSILFEMEYAQNQSQNNIEKTKSNQNQESCNESQFIDRVNTAQFVQIKSDSKGDIKQQIKTENQCNQSQNSNNHQIDNASINAQLQQVQITSDQHENIKQLHEQRDNFLIAETQQQEKDKQILLRLVESIGKTSQKYDCSTNLLQITPFLEIPTQNEDQDNQDQIQKEFSTLVSDQNDCAQGSTKVITMLDIEMFVKQKIQRSNVVLQQDQQNKFDANSNNTFIRQSFNESQTFLQTGKQDQSMHNMKQCEHLDEMQSENSEFSQLFTEMKNQIIDEKSQIQKMIKPELSKCILIEEVNRTKLDDIANTKLENDLKDFQERQKIQIAESKGQYLKEKAKFHFLQGDQACL